ncbi:MAG TPA: glutamine-hydrolyzing carbamoyl-phosphate synthase small subunit [Nitrospiraceae bacterium]|nr:glutamine-hydrolyzing carbamoyl-phosphate synthase small subunit [Nitrospiraceae bacterium]
MNVNKAILALADGTVFEGRALGYEGETCGEVVFNTAMTGYQEVLTDPSYKGQIVMMTCPHIGNYGVTSEDEESRRVWAEGFVIKESSSLASNWRSKHRLDEYLKQAKIVALEGIDTRALTRHLREKGAQQGMISHTDLEPSRVAEKARQAPSIIGRDLAAAVTCAAPYPWAMGTGVWSPRLKQEGTQPCIPSVARWKVVAYDFGIKQNILRRLVDIGCAVTVVPASTTAEAVLAMNPDGIFLSNGPGDPEGVPYAIEAVRQLIGRKPIFGICLGHQLLGLALGLETYKLKFGHHGANHPVLDLRTGRVEITSQNHNFAVKGLSARPASGEAPILSTDFGRVRISHTSLNDESVEGLVCLDQPVFSVQYHPEASPGPHDSAYLFEEFGQLMEKSHG